MPAADEIGGGREQRGYFCVVVCVLLHLFVVTVLCTILACCVDERVGGKSCVVRCILILLSGPREW